MGMFDTDENCYKWFNTKADYDKFVSSCPGVTFCKDCFWLHNSDTGEPNWCELCSGFRDPEKDYCSRAKRKDDAKKEILERSKKYFENVNKVYGNGCGSEPVDCAIECIDKVLNDIKKED